MAVTANPKLTFGQDKSIIKVTKAKKVSKKVKDLMQAEVQTSLYEIAPVVNRRAVWPTIYRTQYEYERLLDKYLKLGYDVGFDIETDIKTKKPNIIGIGFYVDDHPTMGECASIPFSREIALLTIKSTIAAGRQLLGHNVITADKPWTEKELGIVTRLEDWYDTLQTHYGANPHLTKIGQKQEDDDGEGGSSSLGLMNLWSACRCLPLPLTNWKACRGADCQAWGGPCPLHRRFDYNAVDSWAGSALKFFHEKFFKTYDVPSSFKDHLHLIEEIGWKMRRQGVRINRHFVDDFEKNWAVKIKELIEGDGKEIKPLPFNPRSDSQIITWLNTSQKNLPPEDRFTLNDTTKDSVKKLHEEMPESNPAYECIERLFYIKAAGKGAKSWFDDSYFTPFEDLTYEESQLNYE